eukprot:gene11636-4877_t
MKKVLFLVLCLAFLVACQETTLQATTLEDDAFKAKVENDIKSLEKQKTDINTKNKNDKEKETKTYNTEVSENKKTENENDSADNKFDGDVKKFEEEKKKEDGEIDRILNESFEPKISGTYKQDSINKTIVEKNQVKILPDIVLNITKEIKTTTSLFSIKPITKTNKNTLEVDDLEEENTLETKTMESYSVNSNTSRQFDTSCNTGNAFEFFDLKISQCQKKDSSYVIDFKLEYSEVLATAWQGAPESKTKTLNIKNAKIIFESNKVTITGDSRNNIDGYGTFLQISKGKYTITYVDGSDVEIKENGEAKIWKFPSFANAEAITAGGALSAKAYFTEKEFSIGNLVPIIKNTPLESLVNFNSPYLTFTSGGTETLLPYGYILRGDLKVGSSPILRFIQKFLKLSDATMKAKLHPGLILKFFRPEDFKGIGCFIDIDIPTVPIIPNHFELIAPFRYEMGLNFPSFDQRISCIFKVKFPFDKSTLRFLMYFQVGPFPVNNEVQGGAESMDVWKNPFGIKGLTISKLAVDVGFNLAVQPISIVKFGFLGRITLPEVGEIETGAMVDLSEPETPKAIVVAGIAKYPMNAIIKLIGKLTGIKVIAKLPDIALRDVKMIAAPTGGDIGSTQFAPGFQLRGRLTFGKIEFASVNVAISTSLTSALFTDYLCYIDGRTAAINLGPVKVEETTLKVRIAVKEFLFYMYGYVSILGHKMGCEVALSPGGFNLTAEDVFTKLEIKITKEISYVKGALKPKPINQIANVINVVVEKFTKALFSAAKKASQLLAAGLKKIKLPKIKTPKICKSKGQNTLDVTNLDIESVQREIQEIDNYISVLDVTYDEEDAKALGMFSGVRKGFSKVKRGVRKATSSVKKGARKAASGAKKGFRKAATGVKKGVRKGLDAAKKFGKSVKDFSKKYGNKLKKVGLSGYDKIKGVSEKTFKKFSKKLVNELKSLDKLKKSLVKDLKKFKNQLKNKLNKFKNALCSKTRSLIKKVNKKIEKANKMVQKASNRVSKMAAKISGGAGTAFKLVKAEIAATVHGVLDNATFEVHFDSILFGKHVKFDIKIKKSFNKQRIQEYLKKKVLGSVKKIFKAF